MSCGPEYTLRSVYLPSSGKTVKACVRRSPPREYVLRSPRSDPKATAKRSAEKCDESQVWRRYQRDKPAGRCVKRANYPLPVKENVYHVELTMVADGPNAISSAALTAHLTKYASGYAIKNSLLKTLDVPAAFVKNVKVNGVVVRFDVGKAEFDKLNMTTREFGAQFLTAARVREEQDPAKAENLFMMKTGSEKRASVNIASWVFVE